MSMKTISAHKKRGNQAVNSTCFPLNKTVGPELGTRSWDLHPTARVRSPVAPLTSFELI